MQLKNQRSRFWQLGFILFLILILSCSGSFFI